MNLYAPCKDDRTARQYCVCNYQNAAEHGAAPDRFYVAVLLRGEVSCKTLRFPRGIGGG